VVQLPEEDAELLNSLVSLLYPIRPPTPKSYDKALNLLAACKKYDMAQVQLSIRTKIDSWIFPPARGTEVFGAYAIANSKSLIPEMKKAAHATLYNPMTLKPLGKNCDGSRVRHCATSPFSASAAETVV
jgi:hypothetical protein